MARCEAIYPPECDKQGWPELNDHCVDHYRELVVQPLNIAAYDKQREWSDALTKLYKVEVAMGLRPSWRAELRTGPDAVTNPYDVKLSRAKHVSSKPITSREIIIEDEE